jgi:hypothetical protein
MQLVSNQTFLKKCDITGLTMLAWSIGELAKKSNTKFSGQDSKIFEKFMRIIEQQYLTKMRNEVLENQCLIMTIQSFNKLNDIAIKNSLLTCISSREFTDTLKNFCQ